MPRNEPSIEILIPNWNGRHLLKDCLDSLQCQTVDDFAVTVIDNGSTDGSVEFIAGSYPEVRCIALPDNRGFSAAVNAGITQSAAPWILLLNNDMEVQADCLAALHQAIDRDRDYDFFALKMMNFHHRSYIDGAGDGVLRGGAGYRLGTMEIDGPPYDKEREVFGACAGAALYRRDLFDRVGLFDSDFFAYLEDVDLNLRARRLGCRCRFLPGARVYHIGSATSGSKFNPLTIRLSTRNSINVLVKNYPPALLLRYLPVIAIYQLAWFCFCVKKRLLLPYLQGIVAAWRCLPTMTAKRSAPVGAQMTVAEFDAILRRGERDAVESIMARRRSEGKGNGLLRLYCRLFLR
ncbi:MAG TPA: glycosyltransferase family 2 protein [Desulfoprunum sp.]|nr:glycosyltransferase family 2 protein [Desulfoprunum sp.]